MIRLQYEAREDYYLRQRSVEYYMQEQCNTIQELRDMIAALQAEVEHLKAN